VTREIKATQVAPEPRAMPVDREMWARELHISNFINSYYQYRDISQIPGCKSVLVVGLGQGLDTQVLRWRGYEVTTYDIDETFQPDRQGSVHRLDSFSDAQFDVVTASYVLEHLAVFYLDQSLSEIARVGRYALIYLPIAGRHCQLRLIPGVKGIDLSFVVDLYNYLHKPDGVTPRYCQGQHFWEVGMRNFRVRDIAQRISKSFAIIKSYRNYDWHSMNFVVRSLRNR